jgi:hypothetical protein
MWDARQHVLASMKACSEPNTTSKFVKLVLINAGIEWTKFFAQFPNVTKFGY